MEEFFDEDNIEIEHMREERKRMKSKDFAEGEYDTGFIGRLLG